MGPFEIHVFVCTSGGTCPHQGSVTVHAYLKDAVAKAGLKGKVRVNNSGCLDQCGHGPTLVIYPENVWYAGVQEGDLPEILESHILNGVPVKRLIYDPGVKGANKVK